ncbi:MAG: adenylate/guanylate cyclase domain-containing protein [Halopseudomonas sp.]
MSVQISFTRLLSWGFGLLMLVGLGVVLYLGVSSARHNTQVLLSSLSSSQMDSLVSRIDGQLQPVEHQLEYIAASLSDSDFTIDNKRSISLLLEGGVAATPQVMGLLWIEKDRGRTWVGRDDHRVSINAWYERRSSTLSPLLEHPPIGAQWLKPMWSPSLQRVVLPLIQPVYRNNDFVGLLVATITVARLTEFVAQLSEASPAQLFILYGHNQLLASSHKGQEATSNLDREEQLPSLEQLDNVVLQQFWNPNRRPVEWFQSDSTQASTLQIEQQEFIYLTREVLRYGNQPWTVGAYMELDSISEEVARIWQVVAIGLLLIVVLLVLVVTVSRRIGLVVDRTVAGFDAIGQQPLTEIVELPGSQIREFDRVSHAYNRMLEQLRQSEASQRLFGQYVPQAIARELLSHQGQLQPKQCQATVLFCDIEGFTSLTQQLEPGRLVEVLNAYFSMVVEIIEAHNGVVTQFQGDAVLATYNVPITDPQHARQAWLSALAIQQGVNTQQFCGHTLRCRVGVNSGELVAGSVGASERLNYTVHGDAVNLAARLEALNKQFGTRILISEFTADQLEGVALAFVAETEVRGRQGRVKLYTPAADVADLSPVVDRASSHSE